MRTGASRKTGIEMPAIEMPVRKRSRNPPARRAET
jgi:hypothetical protein